MHSWTIFAGMTLLALLLGLNLAFSWKLGGALCRHRRDLDQWRARMDEIRAMMERAKRDTGTVLDKIEDVTAQQVQDWNAVQQEIAVLDGRLGTVERRFGPLAPLEQRVDEVPEAGPDGPEPVEQEAKDER